MSSSISNSGETTTNMFCEITGFNKATNKSDARGDAYSGNIWVEIKKNTMNQVRPCKYVTLVVYDTKQNQWYVIPPDDIVSLLVNTKSKKVKSGQHTPDPIRCIGLSSIRHSKYEKYKVSLQELTQCVIAAYQQGENNQKVKNYIYSYNNKENERLAQVRSDLLTLYA